MRLTPEERAAIRAVAADVFGSDAVVRLFGSRVDDQARGGDIDLHVEAAPDLAADEAARTCFLSALKARIGAQRIDLVVQARAAPPTPIDVIARAEGVAL